MKIKATALALSAMVGLSFGVSTPAAAQEPYLGQIQQFGFNFCPRGWMSTSGQILPISQYTALFSLLGTTYGGDGRTTFALPDLRGRTMIGTGHGPGLHDYRWGQRGGSETNTLTVSQLPSHNHQATLRAHNAPGDTDNPSNALMSDFPAGSNVYSTGSADTNMGSSAIVVGNTGGSQPVNNMQPYLAMTTCIAIQGIFPPRS
ncbi:phage tail protein [Alteriqipengyuania sp.]|uniref:phage tail protein n=1 Tax=Alteriqipengyuania sp. TaxID=2800692 RepID=UPI0035183B5B